MSKHENKVTDFDKPYEANEIGVGQIVYFSLGLFLLIVVTFGLMWMLQRVMEDQKQAEDRENRNPLALSKQERLPPEPRVQAAPGFGVDGPNGRINLELKPPQSEYWELQKIWKKEAVEGQQVAKDGKVTVVTLPLEAAKNAVLRENLKSRSGDAAEKALEETRTIVSGASAGRTRTDRIR